MGVDHADLPLRRSRVAPHHGAHCLRRRCAQRHQGESLIPIGGVAEGLSRHRADPRPGPRDDPADVRELRLHRDAEVSGGGIPGDDAVGVSAFGEIGGRDGGMLQQHERENGGKHHCSFRIFFFSSSSC